MNEPQWQWAAAASLPRPLQWGRLLVCLLWFVQAATGSARVTPPIIDDLDRRSLVRALSHSLAYLETRPAQTRVNCGPNVIPVTRLIATARHLRSLAASNLDKTAFQHRLSRDFLLYSPFAEATGRLLLTGYYQPVFHGRLRRSPPYVYPLYRVPADLVVQKSGGQKPRIGRIEGDRLQPYWTRQEIERNNPLEGGELVWLRDPFDAFSLHVQGSGILEFPDGSRRGVHYAQSNGQPYTSVGRYLVQTGRMQLADVTMTSIRAYLEAHPEEVELILHQNDAFIFFDWSPPGPAVGNLNQPLTAGRSVAADQSVYPPGAVVWVQSRRPVMDSGALDRWTPLQRLLTVQDTGSAIRGVGRLDIFWGTGDQAGLEAGEMKEGGEVAILLLKEGLSP
nr:MltA domain-containing protein [uncultured Desulfobulbus sp.]